MHKRTVNLSPTAAYDEIVARSENYHIDYTDGRQVKSMHIDEAFHLVFTADRVAYICGPLDHDLAVISDLGILYFFNVPHPDIRQEQP